MSRENAPPRLCFPDYLVDLVGRRNLCYTGTYVKAYAGILFRSKSRLALYSLQRALREDGQAEQADAIKQKLAELLRARDKADQNQVAGIQLNNQGTELEKAGNLLGAVEKYRAAAALLPDHMGIRVNFAIGLLRLGHWQQGLAELREAVRREPDNALWKATLDDALAQAPVEFGGQGQAAKAQKPGIKY